MKRIFFLWMLLSPALVIAQGVVWKSFQTAMEIQGKDQKLLFLYVSTSWCGPCKIMERDVFSNLEVQEVLNTKFHSVKFNAEGNEKVDFYGTQFENPNYNSERKGRNATHQLVKELHLEGYPSMHIFDSRGKQIAVFMGLQEVQPFIEDLKKI